MGGLGCPSVVHDLASDLGLTVRPVGTAAQLPDHRPRTGRRRLPLGEPDGPTFWQIFLPIFIALFFLGAAIAADPAYFAELFPTNVRATGVGFPYAFAISLFGGTAPLIATWLGVNDLGWVFTTYCMALALTTALVAWFSPETNGRNLRD